MDEGADIQGILLIGGRSIRMGIEKHTLQLNKKSLLERNINLLSSLDIPVSISCNNSQAEYLTEDYNCIIDRYEDEGPLSGILSCMLSHQKSALVLAVDYPFVTRSTLQYLLENRDATKDATLFYKEDEKNWPALCGIVEIQALDHLKTFFREGGRSVRAFYNKINIHSLPFDPPEFYNLNDRKQWEDISGKL